MEKWVKLDTGDSTSNGVWVNAFTVGDNSAANYDADGPSFAPVYRYGEGQRVITGETSQNWVSSRDWAYVLTPPQPVPVKLALPHKRHLIPVQQRDKEKAQLKVWGLRK